MSRGRPRLPDDERLVSISLRLPKWVIDWYEVGPATRSTNMRHVLERHAARDGDKHT